MMISDTNTIVYCDDSWPTNIGYCEYSCSLKTSCTFLFKSALRRIYQSDNSSKTIISVPNSPSATLQVIHPIVLEIAMFCRGVVLHNFDRQNHHGNA